MHDNGLGRCQPDCLHGFVKTIAILGLIDSILISPDHIDTKFLEHTFASQIQGTIECSLPAHCGQQSIGTLPLNNFGHGPPFHRLDVGRIRHGRIRHDRRRIRVHQNHPVTLFPQGFTGLSTRVVKLAGLPDNNGAGAEDQDTFKIGSFWHKLSSVLQLSLAWTTCYAMQVTTT